MPADDIDWLIAEKNRDDVFSRAQAFAPWYEGYFPFSKEFVLRAYANLIGFGYSEAVAYKEQLNIDAAGKSKA